MTLSTLRGPFLIVLLTFLVATSASRVLAQDAAFQTLWELGIDDDSQGEFSQEAGQDAAPGSSDVQDDDYYFTGQYPSPIGLVPADEEWLNFDRALTGGDPRNRLHFTLSDEQASGFNEFQFSFEVIGSNSLPIPFHVSWNDVQILDVVHEVDPVLYTATITADQVGAVSGPNIITLEREAGAGWIQFDFLRLEIKQVVKEIILEYKPDRTPVASGETVTLSWIVDPEASVTIDNGVGAVDAQTTDGVGSVEVTPGQSTIYTLTVVKGNSTEMASIQVIATILRSFEVESNQVLPDRPAEFSWEVDPDATVKIDPEIGDVSSQTTNGVGSIEHVPENSVAGTVTRYILTAEKNGQLETFALDVLVDLGFESLWTLGIDNGGVGEFSQENQAQDSPGFPDL